MVFPLGTVKGKRASFGRASGRLRAAFWVASGCLPGGSSCLPGALRAAFRADRRRRGRDRGVAGASGVGGRRRRGVGPAARFEARGGHQPPRRRLISLTRAGTAWKRSATRP
jgi:hypothetical protein